MFEAMAYLTIMLFLRHLWHKPIRNPFQTKQFPGEETKKYTSTGWVTWE